eukprot:830438-Prorocentrum_minimum.AAC.12
MDATSPGGFAPLKEALTVRCVPPFIHAPFHLQARTVRAPKQSLNAPGRFRTLPKAREVRGFTAVR